LPRTNTDVTIVMVTIKEYIDVKGHSPFAKWFNRQNAQAAAKVSTVLLKIAYGKFSNIKSVGSGVYEYKIDYGPGYRVYFGKDGIKIYDITRRWHKEAPAKGYRQSKGTLERL